MFEPTLPGVYNGGNYRCGWCSTTRRRPTRHMASEAWAPAKALIDDSGHRSLRAARRLSGGRSAAPRTAAGLFRGSRLFRANVNPTPERLAAFADADLRHAEPYPLDPAAAARLRRRGRGRSALDGTYCWSRNDRRSRRAQRSLHDAPRHWAHVERWFDTSNIPSIWSIRLLVHTFCAIQRPVIV